MARWPEYEVSRRWHRLLLFSVDRAGCLVRRFLTGPRRLPPPRRILVLRPEHLGDLILTLPALQHLRDGFPTARVVLLVRPEYRDWLAGLHVADEVVAADLSWTRREAPARLRGRRSGRLPRARYDLAITFHGDLRTLLLARWLAPAVAGYRSGGGGFLLHFAQRRNSTQPVRQSHLDLVAKVRAGCGLPSAAAWSRHDPACGTAATNGTGSPRTSFAGWGSVPEFGAVEPPGGTAALAPLLRSVPAASAGLPAILPGADFVLLHPGAGQPGKLWFPERWTQVARECLELGFCVVLTGSAAERALCAEIAAGLPARMPPRVLNLAGETSLPTLSALVAGATVVLAPDTGIIHLAVVLGTPSVALFGPNDPRQWGYDTGRHRSLVHRQPCSFCRLAACPRTDAPQACMRAISAAEVIVEVCDLLAGRSRGEHRELTIVLPGQRPASNAT